MKLNYYKLFASFWLSRRTRSSKLVKMSVSTNESSSGEYDEEYYKTLGVDLDLVRKWKEIQEQRRTKVISEDPENWRPDFDNIKLIAGLDISYPKEAHSQGNCIAVTAIVFCKYPSLEKVYEEVEQVQLTNPYVPGFLSFRELPTLVSLINKVLSTQPALKPDLILIDGNGLLHPQECGLACQIGLETNIPTIGVAKNLFHVEGLDLEKKDLQNIANVGDSVELKGKNGRVLGLALKTIPETKNPMYVSVGHKISLESAKKLVLSLCKFRVPEPIRWADSLSREHIRKMGNNL